ncbi:esterase-like activity of phytase family protein [Tateyamaria pelophila]|uniref:esterase-like activity of phytase family protein n=1 Tax=Tateyamaria pelophila TaxID=328415 RepID=UPI001CBC6992|nr:esterase-like activity of phytase family protein [Tateyamaria pelophila]
MRWRLSFALIWLASASLADPLTYLRSISLEGLGGVSAIEVEPGGTPAFVLSDRGTGHRFDILRSGETGRIANLKDITLPYPNRDTEGLAKSEAGTFYSYENPGRVSRETGEPLPSHPDFAYSSGEGRLFDCWGFL